MNELITRHLMAETNSEEERRLLEWRQASAENEARYRRRAQVWALLASTQSLGTPRAPEAGELIARTGIRRLPAHDELGSERTAGSARGHQLRSRFALIGALAAAAIAAVMLNLPGPSQDAPFGALEFIAGPHEAHTIRLDDGTVVRLAPGSRIEFNGQSSRERRVTFEGVGYFAVARDEARPFIIRTQGGEAEVLGTRFELRAERDAMRVVVVEGSVALQAVGQRMEVSTNQMGHAGTNQPPTVVDVEDVNDFLGWVNGLLVFQATPLSRVAPELAKRYGVEIEILNEELGQREVTAWLREQSFDAALTAVCAAVGATCTIHSDRATMDLSRPSGRLTPNPSSGRGAEYTRPSVSPRSDLQ